ncbi:MAG: hypothetical protein ABIQ88_00660 [Chitinophagaceae bacterium]
MKYLFSTVCLALVIVISGGCKKNAVNADFLTGVWELRQAQNGMIPSVDYAPGSGNIFTFSASRYQESNNGNLIKSGDYRLVKDGSVEAAVGLVLPPGQFTTRIIFDNDMAASKTFIEVTNTRLTMLSGYFPLDGGSNKVYEKIADKP